MGHLLKPVDFTVAQNNNLLFLCRQSLCYNGPQKVQKQQIHQSHVQFFIFFWGVYVKVLCFCTLSAHHTKEQHTGHQSHKRCTAEVCRCWRIEVTSEIKVPSLTEHWMDQSSFAQVRYSTQVRYSVCIILIFSPSTKRSERTWSSQWQVEEVQGSSVVVAGVDDALIYMLQRTYNHQDWVLNRKGPFSAFAIEYT